MIAGRDYIQPQWVFDSLNAQRCVFLLRPRKPLPAAPRHSLAPYAHALRTNRLLDTHLYGPGKPLPPHLSPFELANPGHYVPPEALTLQQVRGGCG